jgi:hypothetical protein
VEAVLSDDIKPTTTGHARERAKQRLGCASLAVEIVEGIVAGRSKVTRVCRRTGHEHHRLRVNGTIVRAVWHPVDLKLITVMQERPPAKAGAGRDTIYIGGRKVRRPRL